MNSSDRPIHICYYCLIEKEFNKFKYARIWIPTIRDVYIDLMNDTTLRWVGRKNTLPKRCPRCKRTNWSSEPEVRFCRKCGAFWFLRHSKDGKSHEPLHCPKCNTPYWKNPPPHGYRLRSRGMLPLEEKKRLLERQHWYKLICDGLSIFDKKLLKNNVKR